MSIDKKTSLYRHFDKDVNLLYVGIAYNPLIRLDGHRRQSSWFHDIASIRVEWYPSRKIAEMYEDEAIKSEDPIYNIKGKPGKMGTTIQTVRGRASSRNGGSISYTSMELPRSVEKIWDDTREIARMERKDVKQLFTDILFMYSKNYNQISEFSKTVDLSKDKRRIVLLPYSGDIYNHLRSIESKNDDLSTVVETLLLFYSENGFAIPEPEPVFR
jgi:hypothetical protein